MRTLEAKVSQSIVCWWRRQSDVFLCITQILSIPSAISVLKKWTTTQPNEKGMTARRDSCSRATGIFLALFLDLLCITVNYIAYTQVLEKGGYYDGRGHWHTFLYFEKISRADCWRWEQSTKIEPKFYRICVVSI